MPNDPLGIRGLPAASLISRLSDELAITGSERDKWREVCQRMIEQPITPTVADIIKLGCGRDDVDAMLRVLRDHEEKTG